MRRAIAVVLLVLLVSGCTHYQRSDLPPQQSVPEGSRVKLTLTSGQLVELWQSWARSDSLGGNLRDNGVAWAIPVDSVETVEVRERGASDTVKITFGVIGIAALAVFIGVYIAYCNDFGC